MKKVLVHWFKSYMSVFNNLYLYFFLVIPSVLLYFLIVISIFLDSLLKPYVAIISLISSLYHGDEYDGVIFSQLVCPKSFMKLEHIFFFV